MSVSKVPVSLLKWFLGAAMLLWPFLGMYSFQGALDREVTSCLFYVSVVQLFFLSVLGLVYGPYTTLSRGKREREQLSFREVLLLDVILRSGAKTRSEYMRYGAVLVASLMLEAAILGYFANPLSQESRRFLAFILIHLAQGFLSVFLVWSVDFNRQGMAKKIRADYSNEKRTQGSEPQNSPTTSDLGC